MGADVLTRPRCSAPSAEYNVSFCCETVTYYMVKVNVTIPEIREREWVQLGTDKAFKKFGSLRYFSLLAECATNGRLHGVN